MCKDEIKTCCSWFHMLHDWLKVDKKRSSWSEINLDMEHRIFEHFATWTERHWVHVYIWQTNTIILRNARRVKISITHLKPELLIHTTVRYQDCATINPIHAYDGNIWETMMSMLSIIYIYIYATDPTSSRDSNFQVISIYTYIVQCRYNVVKYYKIFHTTLGWLKRNINQGIKSQITPHNSP